jgi:uncharacterized protein
MLEFLSQPWPWYVAGPILGLIVPLLLILTGKSFGVSSSLRHACAATIPAGVAYFHYDWKRIGLWNLLFVAGILGGGVLAATVFANPDPIALSDAATADLQRLGIEDFTGLVPADLFSWASLFTVPGFVAIVIGGFLLGFGARYAGGCTSGHAIMGLATFQKASLVAVVGFFIGGLLATHILLPVIL